MSGHTEGPWEVGDNFEILKRDQCKHPQIIARVMDDFGAEERLALIAAAPDMLAALTGALAAWDRPYHSFPVNAAIEGAEFDEWQAVRRAIAKATARGDA